MKKHLKLALFISAIFTISGVSAVPADTLKKTKYISFEFNYGLPVFNKLTINTASNLSGDYLVNSRSLSWYEIQFGVVNKRSVLHLGLSLIQSEFTGREYSIGAGTIPYKGVAYPYYYNMYQHVNYNVYYFNIGYAYNFHISNRHVLSPQVQFSIPMVYSFKIDNKYSENQKYDTLLFSPSKNSWNNDTNFGRIPRLGVGVGYKYQILNRLSVNAKILLFYAQTFDRKYPENKTYGSAFNHSENYSFLAYDVSKQVVLIPSIGINIKLN